VRCLAYYILTGLSQGDLFINDYSGVVLREIAFDAGVIYGINSVLFPPGEGADCDRATTLATWVSNVCITACDFPFNTVHKINVCLVDQLFSIL